MRVQIHETGGDEQPRRVDLTRRLAGDVADRRDDTVGDRDVTDERLAAEPVDDRAAANDQIESHALNVRPCHTEMPG